MREININDYVHVQLTDQGREIMWRHIAAIQATSPPRLQRLLVRPPETADGWSVWRLWELMEVFGPHLSLAGDPVFKTTILVSDGRAVEEQS